MNMGIIVEGPYDRQAYSNWIKKIRTDIESMSAVHCEGVGKGKMKSNFVGFLKGFEWNTYPRPEKALVIRDSDCKHPGPLEAELEGILRSAGFQPSFPVHFYATKCKLETLLLADEDAINAVARARGKARTITTVNANLENYRDPENLFRAKLSEVDLPADDAVYGDIAEASDISRIAARCPYFREFMVRVRAC